MIEILLVEDDTNLGISIKKLLNKEGYQVDLVTTLAEAQIVWEKTYQIIILDWMLPDGQGLDFLREIRQKGNNIPIIMLTARVDLIDKILGLESGANDYLTKPFEPRELVARIRVQLRILNNNCNQNSEEIRYGDLLITLLTRKVFLAGEEIELTKMEFDLLKLLAESPGRVFSREEILNKVWGYDNFPTTRTVDTHILQLRNKLSDDFIETMRGVGYRLKVK